MASTTVRRLYRARASRILPRAKAPDAAKRVDDAMNVVHEKLNAIKVKANSGEMGYNQMLAAGNDVGNKLILDGVDALVAQARAIEAVVAALHLKVKIEGSDSLDEPEQGCEGEVINALLSHRGISIGHGW